MVRAAYPQDRRASELERELGGHPGRDERVGRPSDDEHRKGDVWRLREAVEVIVDQRRTRETGEVVGERVDRGVRRHEHEARAVASEGHLDGDTGPQRSPHQNDVGSRDGEGAVEVNERPIRDVVHALFRGLPGRDSVARVFDRVDA